MNLHTNFLQLWSAKFPRDYDAMPRLECLKADQFQTINDQCSAVEVAQSEVTSSVERLRTVLNQQIFVADYLRSCIIKLSAVSKVFSELEENDNPEGVEETTSGGNSPSHPSSDSTRFNQNNTPPDCHATLPCTTVSRPTSALNLSPSAPIPPPPMPPILPSFFSTASPLLSATSRNLLFQSALNQPIKSEATSTKVEASPPQQSTTPTSISPVVSMDEAVRRIVDDMSGIQAPLKQVYGGTESQAPFFKSNSESHTNSFSNSFSAARAAAAAVSAAFGFQFPPAGADFFPSPPVKCRMSSADNSVPGYLGQEDLTNRPYRCATCSRGFAVKAGLMQHLRTHTDERPYPCPECGRAFKQKIQLTTHMRVHSGERPYGCRMCGKLFRQQSHVVQHLRTHTGEKPHKCTRCNKAFRQKYSLISHQRRMCASRTSSASMMAGMTMWIGPGGQAEKVMNTNAPLTNSAPQTTAISPSTTLSNRSYSPSTANSPPRRSLEKIGDAYAEYPPAFPNFPTSAFSTTQTRLEEPVEMSM